MATKKKRSKKKAAATAPKAAAAKKTRLSPKDAGAVKKAVDALWEAKEKPHTLLKEVRDQLLLKCLKDAEGNYAAAADKFGPSRQSVQQYANSPLRDSRWKPFQQNKRR